MFKKSKNKKNGILGIASCIALSTIAVGAIGGSIYYVVENYQPSGEYRDTYDGRVEINPYGYNTIDSTNNNNGKKPDGTTDWTTSELEQNVEDTAVALSGFLNDIGAENYDVSYEYYWAENGGATAYLTFNMPKIEYKDDFYDEKNHDETIRYSDPNMELFNSINSNNYSLVWKHGGVDYRDSKWIDVNQIDPSSSTGPTYSIFSFSYLFDITQDDNENTDPSIRTIISDDSGGTDPETDEPTDSTSTTGILFNATEEGKDILAAINEEFKSYSENIATDGSANFKNHENEDAAPQDTMPTLFIVKDMSVLINKCNYILTLSAGSQSEVAASNLSQYYQELASDTTSPEFLFYQKMASIAGKITDGSQPIDSIASLPFSKIVDANYTTVTSNYNWDVFKYSFDYTTGAFSASSSEDGTSPWSLISNNVPFAPITPSNYFDFFVWNDDFEDSAKKFDDNTAIFLPTEDTNSAEALLKQMNDNVFVCPISSINLTYAGNSTLSLSDAKNEFANFQTQTNIHERKATLNKTIFGDNLSLLISVIGLIVFFLTILVMLVIFYRLPGAFTWLMIMLSLALTLMMMVGFGFFLSVSVMMELFAGFILLLIFGLFLLEKIKKGTTKTFNIGIVVNDSFKSSTFYSLLMLAAGLVFGALFVFSGTNLLISFGAATVFGTFFGWVTVFGFNWILNYLAYNPIDINHKTTRILFSSKKVDEYVSKLYTNDENAHVEKTLSEKYKTPKNISKFTEFTNKIFKHKIVYNEKTIKKVDTSRFNSTFNDPFGSRRVNIFSNKWFYVLIAIALVFIGGLTGLLYTLFSTNNWFNLGWTISFVNMTGSSSFEIDVAAFISEAANQGINLNAGIFMEKTDWVSESWSCTVNLSNAQVETLNTLLSNLAPFGSLSQSTMSFAQGYGTTGIDAINSLFIVIGIGLAIVAVAALLFCNWVSIIPILLSLFITITVSFMAIFIFGIVVNLYVIFAVAIVLIISATFSLFIATAINRQWKKGQLYTKEDIKYMINNEITNGLGFFNKVIIVSAVFVICFTLSAPINIMYLSITMLFGLIMTMINTVYILPLMLYFAFLIRIKLTNHLIKSNERLNQNNLDKVDEQLIEGINHHVIK